MGAAYTLVPSSEFVADVTRLRGRFRRIADDIGQFLERELSIDPRRCGRLIPRTSGAWKARCGIPSAHISKRDGLRLIYGVNEQHHAVVLIMLYYKKEQADVAAGELRRAVERIVPTLQKAAIERGLDPASITESLRKLIERR
jgi:mRNA-degrading endonuclease RelE of RelBE toxin-antitoxin system